MEYPRPDIYIDGEFYKLFTLDEFRKKKDVESASNATISYNLNEDKLDYCKFGRTRMIIWNSKAEAWSLGMNGPKK